LEDNNKDKLWMFLEVYIIYKFLSWTRWWTTLAHDNNLILQDKRYFFYTLKEKKYISLLLTFLN